MYVSWSGKLDSAILLLVWLEHCVSLMLYLKDLPPPAAWKLVSRGRKEESCLQSGVALRTVPKRAVRNFSSRAMYHQQSVGVSWCGEIKEREQIFDLGIKNIFRKNIYLMVEGVISTAGREIPFLWAL